MNKKAFTIVESMVVILLIGFFALFLIKATKIGEVKDDVLKQGGLNIYGQLDLAIKKLLYSYSYNNDMRQLQTIDGDKFSIVDSNADEKFIALLKVYVKELRGKTLSSQYKNAKLIDEADNEISSLSAGSFAKGYFLKNGAYIGIKLNGACDVQETNVFSPQTRAKSSIKNSCGLIFYDVNGPDDPNRLLIDQYILSIGKYGIR